MSDFFGHLLAQLHPPANVLQPRAASRFETARGDGDPWRIEFVQEAAPAPMPATPQVFPGQRTPEAPAPHLTEDARALPRARRHAADPVASQASPGPWTQEAPARQLTEAALGAPRGRRHAADPVAAVASPRAERPDERNSTALADRAKPLSARVMVEGATREVRTEVTSVAVEPMRSKPEEPADRAIAPIDMPRTIEAQRAAEAPQSPELLVAAAAPSPLAAAPLEPQITPEIAAPQAAEPMPATVIEVRIGRIDIHAPEVHVPSVAAPVPALAAGGSRLDRYLSRS